jgi:hypothetical protein
MQTPTMLKISGLKARAAVVNDAEDRRLEDPRGSAERC